MQAAASRILTRRSSNCSKISFQSGLPSSAGNSTKKKTTINSMNISSLTMIFTIRSISFEITFNTFFRETFRLFDVVKSGNIFFGFSPWIVDDDHRTGRTTSQAWSMHGHLELHSINMFESKETNEHRFQVKCLTTDDYLSASLINHR